MSRARLLILLIALACAGLAAFIARGLLQNSGDGPAMTSNQPPQEPRVNVLVAAKDLAMGERLSAGALTWREWPASNVADSMITQDARPDALEGLAAARARLPILNGEPIADRKVVQPNDRSLLSSVLPKGMRAIAIEVTERTAVSGFVLPNDRVDVLLTPSDVPAETLPVVTNVRVLAINQTFGQADPDTSSLTDLRTAVLELDPKQSEAVLTAAAAGVLSLALRSIAEGGDEGLISEKAELASRSPTTVIRAGVEARVTP